MNDTNTIELVGDADTVATLVAANNGLPTDGEGEASPEEATVFIAEDETSIVPVA